jgi:thiamine-monophosphate kinase
VTRTGARIGDAIYVTGQLGGSMEDGHHFRFTPRLAEGAWLARQAGVRAMMDVSDGLAKDLHAITPPRAVPRLDPTLIPRRHGVSLRAALSDGEDYELLFAFAARADARALERRWSRAFPRTTLTRIGTFVDRGADMRGAVDLDAFRGYEHLAASSRRGAKRSRA